VFNASATVLFEDSFESNSGALHNRRPDAYDSSVGALAWWKNESLNLVVTNGVLQTTTTTGQQSAWLTLPPINTGDVIRASAVVVANGDVNTDWLSFGFLQSKNHTHQKGEPFVTLSRFAVDPGANTGQLKIYGGLGNVNLLAANSWLKEQNGFSTNLNARNTVTFEYDTASGSFQVWLTSEGGTTVTQYNGSVNYGGVEGQIVPLDELNYFGLTFNSVVPLGAANPAYLDDLVVERIPYQEPQLAALFEDSFENNSGDLHNRRPDVFDSEYASIAWWKNEAQDLLVTNGVLQTTTNDGQQSAWLNLPTITEGDVIRASAVVVASGDANTDWLSIGLLQSKDGTFETGGPYVTLTRRAVDPGADLGLLRIYGGLGNTNELATLNNLKEAQGFTTNLNARNTVSFEYDTASGNLQVWLTSEGGTTVTHYDGSVDYNGVVGQAVPLGDLNYFGITFNSLNSADGSNPAYIDDVNVVYIPGANSGVDPVIPATIIGWSMGSNNLMRMVIDAQSAASNYFPKATTDLTSGIWNEVAHSDDGVNAFAVTNLDYAGVEGTNKVIYLQADETKKFFGIWNP